MKSVDTTQGEIVSKLCNRAVEIDALQFGKFTLASGRTSEFYFDGRMLSLDPIGAELVAELFWREILKHKVEAFGGPAIGSVPIVGALVYKAAQEKRTDLKGFFVRSIAKQHGTQKTVEGMLKPRSRVLVVEDTVTTGGSLLKAIGALRNDNHEVVHAVALLDRAEGAKQEFAKHNIPFSSFLTIADLISLKR